MGVSDLAELNFSHCSDLKDFLSPKRCHKARTEPIFPPWSPKQVTPSPGNLSLERMQLSRSPAPGRSEPLFLHLKTLSAAVRTAHAQGLPPALVQMHTSKVDARILISCGPRICTYHKNHEDSDENAP